MRFRHFILGFFHSTPDTLHQLSHCPQSFTRGGWELVLADSFFHFIITSASSVGWVLLSTILTISKEHDMLCISLLGDSMDLVCWYRVPI